MAITLINAPGLAKKLRDAGLGIEARHYDDGRQPELVTPDDAAAQAIIDAYTVAEAGDYLCAEISAHAKSLRDRAVADVSPGEMASWPIKRSEALAYAQTGNPATAPLLSAEAASRGVTLADMIGRVSGNATRLAMLEAQIGGTDGRHRDAVRACTTFAQIAAYDWSAGWPEVP